MAAAADSLLREYLAREGTSAETRAQLEAAVKVVGDLADSGVLGAGVLKASLGGHANRDHTAPEGVAGDVVTVSVYVASPAEAELLRSVS